MTDNFLAECSDFLKSVFTVSMPGKLLQLSRISQVGKSFSQTLVRARGFNLPRGIKTDATNKMYCIL